MNRRLSILCASDNYPDPIQAEAASNNHVVANDDYNNIAGLLKILSRQLDLSMEESQKDHQRISDYCMDSKANFSIMEVIQSLQYFDLCNQRVLHVAKSLSLLVENLLDERWDAIDVDLDLEIKKTHSFYDEQ